MIKHFSKITEMVWRRVYSVDRKIRERENDRKKKWKTDTYFVL